MRIVFQNELASLQSSLVEIAQLVEHSIVEATEAFIETDTELADRVAEYGAKITAKCAEIDLTAIDILARQAPVASDLRLVVSSLRISSSLERMGDLSDHIASLVKHRFPKRATPKGLKKIFREMGDLDAQIAALLVSALQDPQSVTFAEIDATDDQIDALHEEVFARVLSDEFTGDSSRVVDATLASRYHERFGDHAVEVARLIDSLG